MEQDEQPRATVHLEGERLVVTLQVPELARKVALLARATRRTPERVFEVYWGSEVLELEHCGDGLEDCWFADDGLALAAECIESALRHWAPALCWDWDMDAVDTEDDLVSWVDEVNVDGWPRERVKQAVGYALSRDFDSAWAVLETVCKELKIDAEHMPPEKE